MTKEQILEKWKMELHYYTSAYNVSNVREISNVSDRSKAEEIQKFIQDIEQLQSQPKQEEKDDLFSKYEGTAMLPIKIELNNHKIIYALKCSECDNYFEKKEIIIKGDRETCDSCLCPG